MPTATAHRTKSAPIHGLKARPDKGAGVFEAVVAVFRNVDHMNDRIVPGAFAKDLAAWASSGDAIPVIFSHRWDDLASHLGVVTEAKELMPGDEALPPEIRDNGGLWVRMSLDVDDPKSDAGRVATLLGRRSLKEFSFAYDVKDYETVDGVNELRELELFEVGPTLKGANPLTALLGGKSVTEARDELRVLVGELVDERVAALAAAGSAPPATETGSVVTDGNAEGNREDPPAGQPREGEEPTGADPGRTGDDAGTGEATRLALEIDLLEVELAPD